MADQPITHEFVRGLFDYDPDSGRLVWKFRPREHFSSSRIWKSTNTRCAGKEVGLAPNADGYLSVSINRVGYKAHRIIWLWMHGEMPEQIDHINGDRSDNRASNLRAVTHAQNMKNKRKRQDNKSGVTGVNWHAKDGRWVAHISVDGVTERIGCFLRKEDAAAARKDAERKHGFSERHGL